MALAYILLDVDDTLYAQGQGPFKQVTERIGAYVTARLGLAQDEALALRRRYVAAYGSTMGGLVAHHGVDPLEFLDYVHDVPVETILQADARLFETLTALPAPLAAFSNGSQAYVRRVLEALGVGELFSQILAIEDFDFIPKPQQRPYLVAQDRLGLSAPELLLADDRPENVAAARQYGLKAVQVGGVASDGQVIATIYELPRFLKSAN